MRDTLGRTRSAHDTQVARMTRSSGAHDHTLGMTGVLYRDRGTSIATKTPFLEKKKNKKNIIFDVLRVLNVEVG